MIGTFLRESIILVVFFSIFLSGEDILENYRPSPGLPEELNRWLASVQRHKDDFALIRYAANRYGKNNIPLSHHRKREFKPKYLVNLDDDKGEGFSEERPENDIYPYMYRRRVMEPVVGLIDYPIADFQKSRLRLRRDSAERADNINLDLKANTGEILRPAEKYPGRYKNDATKDMNKRDIHIDVYSDGKLMKQTNSEDSNAVIKLNIQPKDDINANNLIQQTAHAKRSDILMKPLSDPLINPLKKISDNSKEEANNNFRNLFSANEHLNTDTSTFYQNPLIYHVSVPDINAYLKVATTEEIKNIVQPSQNGFKTHYNQNGLKDMSPYWTQTEKNIMQKGLEVAQKIGNLPTKSSIEDSHVNKNGFEPVQSIIVETNDGDNKANDKRQLEYKINPHQNSKENVILRIHDNGMKISEQKTIDLSTRNHYEFETTGIENHEPNELKKSEDINYLDSGKYQNGKNNIQQENESNGQNEQVNADSPRNEHSFIPEEISGDAVDLPLYENRMNEDQVQIGNKKPNEFDLKYDNNNNFDSQQKIDSPIEKNNFEKQNNFVNINNSNIENHVDIPVRKTGNVGSVPNSFIGAGKKRPLKMERINNFGRRKRDFLLKTINRQPQTPGILKLNNEHKTGNIQLHLEDQYVDLSSIPNRNNYQGDIISAQEPLNQQENHQADLPSIATGNNYQEGEIPLQAPLHQQENYRTDQPYIETRNNYQGNLISAQAPANQQENHQADLPSFETRNNYQENHQADLPSIETGNNYQEDEIPLQTPLHRKENYQTDQPYIETRNNYQGSLISAQAPVNQQENHQADLPSFETRNNYQENVIPLQAPLNQKENHLSDQLYYGTRNNHQDTRPDQARLSQQGNRQAVQTYFKTRNNNDDGTAAQEPNNQPENHEADQPYNETANNYQDAMNTDAPLNQLENHQNDHLSELLEAETESHDPDTTTFNNDTIIIPFIEGTVLSGPEEVGGTVLSGPEGAGGTVLSGPEGAGGTVLSGPEEVGGTVLSGSVEDVGTVLSGSEDDQNDVENLDVQEHQGIAEIQKLEEMGVGSSIFIPPVTVAEDDIATQNECIETSYNPAVLIVVNPENDYLDEGSEEPNEEVTRKKQRQTTTPNTQRQNVTKISEKGKNSIPLKKIHRIMDGVETHKVVTKVETFTIDILCQKNYSKAGRPSKPKPTYKIICGETTTESHKFIHKHALLSKLNKKFPHRKQVQHDRGGYANYLVNKKAKNSWVATNGKSAISKRKHHRDRKNKRKKSRLHSNTPRKYIANNKCYIENPNKDSDSIPAFVGRRLKFVDYIYDADLGYPDLEEIVPKKSNKEKQHFEKRKIVKKESSTSISILHKDSAEGDYGEEEESDSGKKRKDENKYVKKTKNNFANPVAKTTDSEDYYNDDDYEGSNKSTSKNKETTKQKLENIPTQKATDSLGRRMHPKMKPPEDKSKKKINPKKKKGNERKKKPRSIEEEPRMTMRKLEQQKRKVVRNPKLQRNSEFQQWPKFMRSDQENQENLRKRSLATTRQSEKSNTFPLSTRSFFVTSPLFDKQSTIVGNPHKTLINKAAFVADDDKNAVGTANVTQMDTINLPDVSLNLDSDSKLLDTLVPVSIPITNLPMDFLNHTSDKTAVTDSEVTSQCTDPLQEVISNACEDNQGFFNYTQIPISSVLPLVPDMENRIGETYEPFEKLDPIINGEIPFMILDHMFVELKKKNLQHFKKGLRRTHTMETVDKILTSSNQESKKVIAEMSNLLNKLQISTNCQSLHSRLKHYLKLITKTKTDSVLRRAKEMEGRALDEHQNADRKKSFVFASPELTDNLEDKASVLKGLLNKYENLPDRCKPRALPIKEYIERHLGMLNNLLSEEDSKSTENIDKDVSQTETTNEAQRPVKNRSLDKTSEYSIKDTPTSDSPENALVEQQLESLGLGENSHFKPSFDLNAIISQNRHRKDIHRRQQTDKNLRISEKKRIYKRHSESYEKLSNAIAKEKLRKVRENRLGQMYGKFNDDLFSYNEKSKQDRNGFESPQVYSF